ncbi:heterokaryon incompatibility protein [Colletotrichum sojae]|uniref:Heterokaryon incompatibility protein n=1 Tax=Colletotrichum sojae TaxID=2175907 RepID=A0A8H6J9R6_9PEZI|nr:heterokaryon incompatibility protein [Colletotrichum sojae]
MQSNPPKVGPLFTHHCTIRSLRKSATEGCRICVTIWHDIATRKTRHGKHMFEVLHFGRTTTWGVFYEDIIFINFRSEAHACRFRFISATKTSFRPDRPLPWPSLHPRLIEDHTGSSTSLNLAKEWLSACIRSHSSCYTDSDVNFRPSRLLHISADHHVRLHTSNEYPEASSYMTLSHCWGGVNFIQLRQSNQDAFRRGIPWESLPQTFKDAIRIARHMGAAYLWIDSLSILQDSAEDWRIESAMMGSIYKYASCNIAASDAPNSREGCLYPRNHRTLPLERLHWSSDEESDSHIINVKHTSDPSDLLYSRAWVLQEALLARRTLDCGRDQLFWRCDELLASEGTPDGFPPTWSEDYHHPSFRLLGLPTTPLSSLRLMAKEMKEWDASNQEVLQTPGFRGNSEAILDAYYSPSSPSKVWINIVELYSRMSLTKDTDRPVALMGILDTFSSYLGQYLAGIRAPSWSWMSLEGPVHLRGHCEVMSWGSEDVLLSQFLGTEVVSAHDIRLRVKAPLVRATRVDQWTEVVPRALLALRRKPVVSGLRIGDYMGINKWRVSRHRLGDDDVNAWIRLAYDEAKCESTVLDMDLMAIRQRCYGTVSGLVLQENPDGSFTRVGCFEACDNAAKIFLQDEQTEVVLV